MGTNSAPRTWTVGDPAPRVSPVFVYDRDGDGWVQRRAFFSGRDIDKWDSTRGLHTRTWARLLVEHGPVSDTLPPGDAGRT